MSEASGALVLHPGLQEYCVGGTTTLVEPAAKALATHGTWPTRRDRSAIGGEARWTTYGALARGLAHVQTIRRPGSPPPDLSTHEAISALAGVDLDAFAVAAFADITRFMPAMMIELARRQGVIGGFGLTLSAQTKKVHKTTAFGVEWRPTRAATLTECLLEVTTRTMRIPIFSVPIVKGTRWAPGVVERPDLADRIARERIDELPFEVPAMLGDNVAICLDFLDDFRSFLEVALGPSQAFGVNVPLIAGAIEFGGQPRRGHATYTDYCELPGNRVDVWRRARERAPLVLRALGGADPFAYPADRLPAHEIEHFSLPRKGVPDVRGRRLLLGLREASLPELRPVSRGVCERAGVAEAGVQYERLPGVTIESVEGWREHDLEAVIRRDEVSTTVWLTNRPPTSVPALVNLIAYAELEFGNTHDPRRAGCPGRFEGDFGVPFRLQSVSYSSRRGVTSLAMTSNGLLVLAGRAPGRRQMLPPAIR